MEHLQHFSSHRLQVSTIKSPGKHINATKYKYKGKYVRPIILKVYLLWYMYKNNIF